MSLPLDITISSTSRNQKQNGIQKKNLSYNLITYNSNQCCHQYELMNYYPQMLRQRMCWCETQEDITKPVGHFSPKCTICGEASDKLKWRESL